MYIIEEVAKLVNDIKKEYEDKEKKIKAKYSAYKTIMLGLILYGVFVTVLTAFYSEVFIKHFIDFFTTIWNGISYITNKIINLSLIVANLCKNIPQNIIANILYWIVLVLLIGLIIFIIGYLILKIIQIIVKIVKNYELNDTILLIITLISFSLIVWFAEGITEIIPINLMFLFIIFQVFLNMLRIFYKCFKVRKQE